MVKQKKKHVFFLLICVFVFGLYFNFKICVQAKDFSLTVIHTNDSHGTVSHEPYLKTLAEQKKNNGENVLILSAGDLFHGQLVATLSRGESIVNIFNMVGYDYITAGNHDFNYGLDGLKNIESQGNFKILISNVVDKTTGKNIFIPYDIKEIDGVKIGIFGLATPETLAKSSGRKSLEGTEFLSPTETSKKIVDELKSQGCKIIIAITHLGLDDATLDENRSDFLAKNVPEIDLIIDGHSHTELKNGLEINNTLIAQTGSHGKNIGVVDLKLNSNGKNNSVLEKKAYLIKIDDNKDILPDENVLNMIEEENKKIEGFTSEKIGEIGFDLDGQIEHVRKVETNFFDLLTDAILEKTKSDVVILNGGIIRDSIKAGEITVGDIYKSLPFENTMITQNMSGKEILKALEHGVSQYPNVFGGNLQVSGIKFKFDPNKKIGEKVYDVYFLNNNQKLDLDKKYNLATVKFLFDGGDGYDMFTKNESYKEYNSPQEMLIEYIKNNNLEKYRAVQNRIVAQERKQEQKNENNKGNNGSKQNAETSTDNNTVGSGYSWTTIESSGTSSSVNSSSSTSQNLNSDNQTTNVQTSLQTESKVPEKLRTRKYLIGYDNGKIKPENYVTNAEFATIVYRLMNDGEKVNLDNLDKISDVEKSDWFGNAVAYLIDDSRKIINITDKKFRPNENINGYEMMNIVHSVLKFYGAEKDSVYAQNLNSNITRAKMAEIIFGLLERKSNPSQKVYSDLDKNHLEYKFLMDAAE